MLAAKLEAWEDVAWHMHAVRCPLAVSLLGGRWEETWPVLEDCRLGGGAPTGPLVHCGEAATFLPNTPQFVGAIAALRCVHVLHASHSG